MTSRSSTSQALQGTKVVDLSTGPTGGLVSMILADFGAEVISFYNPNHPLNKLNATPMWQRGKYLFETNLDNPNICSVIFDYISCADVIISNWRDGQDDQFNPKTLRKAHPNLVVCHISGFGRTGPLKNLPGYEHLAAALSGRMNLFAGLADRPGPTFSALQVGVHATSQSAVAGILAALYERSKTGHARMVETSLLRGLLAYEQGAALTPQFLANGAPVPGPAAVPEQPPAASLYYHPAQAGDGTWMQFGNLLPHLFDAFLINTDLIDFITDPDFDPKQLLFTDPNKHEAARERMLLKIQEQDADSWMQTFIADGGVVAGKYQTTQQALNDQDIIDNGHVIEVAGIKQIGPLARLTKTPAAVNSSLQADISSLPQWQPHQQPAKPIQQDKPLAGVKVVEIATIIAAPLGATLLADMGADVIKVEQIGGDPYRSMLAGIGAARVNAGKRSISINLKTDTGQEVVHKLLADADVLIHNYRPGVPEKLGIGYEQLQSLNPNLIYLQSNGYGPLGPSALRPSTHPIPGAAMGGVMYQLGENLPTDLQDVEGLRLWTARLMRANEVNPDPNTALVIASSVMLGLMARQINGVGQQIQVDMFGANAYANHDDFLTFANKPQRLLPDKGLHGLSATYRLYECQENSWIFLAAITDQEKQSLNQALANLGYKTELAADALSKLFIQKTATYWAEQLLPQNIGCVDASAALPQEFWLNHPHAIANNFMTSAEHPAWGPYLRHGSMVEFSDTNIALKPPPLAGQHNVSLLEGLGYSQDSIEEFETTGVIWQQA